MGDESRDVTTRGNRARIGLRSGVGFRYTRVGFRFRARIGKRLPAGAAGELRGREQRGREKRQRKTMRGKWPGLRPLNCVK